MLDQLVSRYHLHPIADHFTIALLAFGIAAELAAATILLGQNANSWLSAFAERLQSVSLLLMLGGAAAAVVSYVTGDSEADRLWDTLSPAAQQILLAPDGAAHYLSHAMLGHYLMYAFLMLAVWRVALEFSARLVRWRLAFLLTATMAAGALLYQGKTGGELVYDHGAGTPGAATAAQRLDHPLNFPSPNSALSRSADEPFGSDP